MRALNRKFTAAGLALLLSGGSTFAAGTHPHTHEDSSEHSAMEQTGNAGNGHGHQQGSAAHRHDSWATPPAEYAQLRYDNWTDAAAAERGEKLYKQNCAVCHGEKGNGQGPAASGLEHKPADLTNHFHTAPGEGDGYLYWRVTEGGVVEPFRSMKSAMPPFKGSLNEAQRWEVLTYIHQKFHGGFPESSPQGAALNGAGAKPHRH